MTQPRKTVLHVGCGLRTAGKLHPAFAPEAWDELRLDIDPAVAPDIVGSITDMSAVGDGTVDAVFSAHNLEHLYPHEVPLALREFRRVLRPEGLALITVPDLQTVCAVAATHGLETVAYISPLGPIAPIDMLFGFRPALAAGNTFMAHNTGFTGPTLLAALREAGFAYALTQRAPESFGLWGIGFAAQPDEPTLRQARSRMLPAHHAPDPVPRMA